MILSTHGIISSASSGSGSPLLLDTYSSAAAAYSLRKLRTAYTGNAITVRRSSDNTSQNIGFDANGNLDTASMLSFVGAGNGFVSLWYDQSGNGYNLTQTTSANQFRIVYGGVLDTLNGKVSTVANYNYANVAFASASFGTSYSQTTVIHIGSHNNTTLKWLWSTLSDINPNRVECYQESTSILSLYAGGNMQSSYSLSINTQRLIYAKYQGLTSKIAINNATGTSGNAGSNSMSGVCLNTAINLTAYSAASYIQEFLIFQGDQDANRTGISSNINLHYTIY